MSSLSELLTALTLFIPGVLAYLAVDRGLSRYMTGSWWKEPEDADGVPETKRRTVRMFIALVLVVAEVAVAWQYRGASFSEIPTPDVGLITVLLFASMAVGLPPLFRELTDHDVDEEELLND